MEGEEAGDRGTGWPMVLEGDEGTVVTPGPEPHCPGTILIVLGSCVGDGGPIPAPAATVVRARGMEPTVSSQ